jgi:stage V sporulation protein R
MSKLLFEPTQDWNFHMLQEFLEVSEQIGVQDLGMNLYANQIEIISAEQMLDAYSSVGMPIMYNHWSFGKRLVRDSDLYKKGHMGLAYELVINSDPAIAYCMEDNSAIMQLLVIAHASVGHNFCFANNYMFKKWTHADAIIDYLNFAKHYVRQCEYEHGADEVEKTLDSLHALDNLGVDKYMRVPKLNARKEADRQKERLSQWEQQQTEFWTRMDPHSHKHKPKPVQLLDEPQENLLYFLEKHSPILKPWQRELTRIVRKISQYWWPQKNTKLLNEGIATFTHHYILNKLWDTGRISDGAHLEWLQSHAGVIYQPPYNHNRYSGINPYALGFAIFQDIRRMCENPTPEDSEWFPQLKGADWKEVIRSAATDYRDDAFVQQWLSPKVMRDFRLFSIQDRARASHVTVSHIHDADNYAELRHTLSTQYDVHVHEPQIYVTHADLKGDRCLHLVHHAHNNQQLAENHNIMLKHVKRLWGYPVQLSQLNTQTGAEQLISKH